MQKFKFWVKTKIPSKETLRKNKLLDFFGEKLFAKELWSIEPYSLAKGVGFGLFWCFIPMPFQMVPTAIMCVIFKANIPFGLLMVWISNPLTWLPIYYATYVLGTLFFDIEMIPFSEIESLNDFLYNSEAVLKPLYFGSTLTGLVLAVVGFFSVLLGFVIKNKIKGE